MSNLVARIGSVGRELVDMVLPPRCVTCRELTMGQAGLCPRCWSCLTFIDAPRCAVSGVPFPYGAEGDDLVSPAALKSPPLYERARGAVIYDDHSRLLVHALKYHDRHETALPMARLMALAGRDVIASSDLLMPVPLHRWRLWRRRYNQAALLANRIARRVGKPCHHHGLLRIRATASQVGLDAKRRARNVRGAFAVLPALEPEVSGRRVLLIDDVLTTGATSNACAQALLQAGAAAVNVLVFALAAGSHRLHI
ncbi:MAG TPA: ComF family protein [Aestuariivirgaceae bacterium]|nr:ComF family protein [Aestuariivirgaceae bacterium]